MAHFFMTHIGTQANMTYGIEHGVISIRLIELKIRHLGFCLL